MVVDNLHVRRTRRAGWPLEANPPLIIDTDTVLAFAIAAERLQTIAGNGLKILQRLGTVKAQQSGFRLPPEPIERFDPAGQSAQGIGASFRPQ